ncbi:hypothetical protein GCM10022415_29050 [Knoellia locipacati]|uniref:Type I restriction modification DNA specificity domain-containing protein n=1 Tax=Knoellia locipacati TaxID=882824 RepID=A0A512T4K1_9MICO|nr:hypothetical protein KLO01_31910 [Knoellia locipacati]
MDVLDARRIPVKASDRAVRGGEIPYYGATGQAGTIDRAIFDEPLVLLGEDGAPFLDPYKSKAYLVDGPSWVNNHAHVLRPRDGLDRKFLRYYLDVFDYRGYANGTTRLKLTQASMRGMPVPIPHLREQRRIVDTLEDHLSRLDAGDRYLVQNIKRMNGWAASMADELIWSPGYSTRELGSLLREPMRNGRSDRAVTKGSAGIRALTLTAVTRNEFTDVNTKLTTTSPHMARGLWLEPGDILVQRSNTPDLVGTTARYEGPREWAIFPDLLIRVRPDEEVISSAFMCAVLRSERAHRSLRARAKGLAGSMPKIDQAAIAAVQIPVPNPRGQESIVNKLAEVESTLVVLLTTLRAQQRKSAALRRSLLRAAFSGSLAGRSTCDEVHEELAQ